MKKLLAIFLLTNVCSFAFAQSTLTPTQWENMKQSHQIDGSTNLSIQDSTGRPFMEYHIAQNVPVHPASNSCACWQQRDTSWHPIPCSGYLPPDYRNDDGSTGLINLPFSFCLYGTNWTDCYINNNGNVSFGSPYGTFTASGFPNAFFTMVAPFWSDVDTRNVISGLPWYVITPTYMIVQWDSVGYYANHVDKINTFQLIITNGSDPIVPGGNVSFCYKDMAWTTGDASSGVGGFGGSDAIVGANKGDGVNYIQFGAFNQPGAVYNGPLGPNSGIDWLDNQTFIFDACANSNNIPPTVNGLSVCDTLTLCEGDTLPLSVTFFSPEGGQTTTITVDTTGTTGYVQTSNIPGNTASLVAYFVGSAANAGYSTVIITATDDGTPNGVTTIPIIIHVIPAPVVTASNDTTVCAGSTVNLFATGGTTYSWTPSATLSDPNISNPVATPTTTTTYVVTASSGCDVTEPVVVTVQVPVANAGNDQTICAGQSVILSGSGGTSFSWAPSTDLNNPNIQNPLASPTVTTTYTLTVTDGLGCAATDVVTIFVNPSPTGLFSYTPGVAFIDSTFTFTDATLGASSWTWSFGDNTSSTQQNPVHSYSAAGTYHVCLIVSNGNCADTICQDVIVMPHDVVAPNVFTPNGDNNNDMLVFQNLEYFPNSKIEIYDRWGVLVYENGNYLNDWRGTKNGGSSECVDGTYYYILSGPNIKTPITGFVQLIRGK